MTNQMSKMSSTASCATSCCAPPRPRAPQSVQPVEDWRRVQVESTTDFTDELDQEMVCQIPRMMTKCRGKMVTDEFIAEQFDENGIGDVTKIDWRGPFDHCRPDGSVVHSYWEVYVYFKEWYNTPEAAKFQKHVRTEVKTKLWYDQDNYWIVNQCKNPMSKRECMMRDEIRKLKCQLYDAQTREAEREAHVAGMEAYYSTQMMQRDDYIAQLQQYIGGHIDNYENGLAEDPLHDDHLPGANEMWSAKEPRGFELSPPPSPTSSSGSVDNDDEDLEAGLMRTLSTHPEYGLERTMTCRD